LPHSGVRANAAQKAHLTDVAHQTGHIMRQPRNQPLQLQVRLSAEDDDDDELYNPCGEEVRVKNTV